jgi:hypothetical protein
MLYKELPFLRLTNIQNHNITVLQIVAGNRVGISQLLPIIHQSHSTVRQRALERFCDLFPKCRDKCGHRQFSDLNGRAVKFPLWFSIVIGQLDLQGDRMLQRRQIKAPHITRESLLDACQPNSARGRDVRLATFVPFASLPNSRRFPPRRQSFHRPSEPFLRVGFRPQHGTGACQQEVAVGIQRVVAHPILDNELEEVQQEDHLAALVASELASPSMKAGAQRR